MLFLIVGLVLMAAFKLWLVRGDRIVARPLPADDLDYLKAASHWYWGAKYGVLAFVRLPGYPLFVSISKASRLPLRFTTELIQLAGAAAAALAFYFSGVRRGLCLMLYGALIFHPATFAQNSFATPDPFFKAITFFAVGAMVMQLSTRRLVFAALSGLAIGVLWNTREEAILMAGYLAGFFAILLWSWRGAWREVAWHAMVTCAVIAVICIACDTANYKKYGNFAKSDFASHDFQAALKAMLRIKPVTPPPRFAAIPAQTRDLAYAASPALRELQPLLDGTAPSGWKEAGEPLGIVNDYALGYLLWALRDAAAQAGKYDSPQITRAYYREIADQINGAISRGELPHRFVFSTFTDPDLSEYVRYLPASLGRICGTFAAAEPPIAPPWSVSGEPVSPRQAELFQRMTNETETVSREGDPVTRAIRGVLARFYGPAVACLTVVAAVALGYLLCVDRARFVRSPAFAVLALLLMMVAGRVVILGLIDVSSWNANSPRYLLPIMGLYSCALGILIDEAVATIASRPRP